MSSRIWQNTSMVTHLLKLKKYRRVALLATGDEITNGDILNTNAQAIAQQLTANNIDVGLHASTSDKQLEIKNAIVFLLKTHDSLIITGGLGPTSDDRTRYAISAALRKPLIFDALSWDNIVNRIKHFTSQTPPESNRQQALFPKGAHIFENPHGTAGGCGIYLQGKWIFMLPGPPNECLPMFQHHVLPTLIKANYPANLYRRNWLLYDVSEGQIATELDTLLDPYKVSTGYRIAYPYLEFKIQGKDQATFEKACQVVQARIAPHLLNDTQEPISQSLLKYLSLHKTPLSVDDNATGGMLETLLKTPETASIVHFSPEKNNAADLHLHVKGLTEYWQNETNAKETRLSLHFAGKCNTQLEKIFLLRGKKTRLKVIEYICAEILKIISK